MIIVDIQSMAISVETLHMFSKRFLFYLFLKKIYEIKHSWLY